MRSALNKGSINLSFFYTLANLTATLLRSANPLQHDSQRVRREVAKHDRFYSIANCLKPWRCEVTSRYKMSSEEVIFFAEKEMIGNRCISLW